MVVVPPGRARDPAVPTRRRLLQRRQSRLPLYWFRRWIGVRYRLLFSNGGPCRPPFVRLDFVHQVNPVQLEEALRAGEPADKHIMVPYGVDRRPASRRSRLRRALRERLGLPAHQPVVLSVGWISRTHKRMDYVVEEVPPAAAPRPFLMLLGALDRSSDEILRLAHERLGPWGVRRAQCRITRSRRTTRRPTASCSPRSAKASAGYSWRPSPTACP